MINGILVSEFREDVNLTFVTKLGQIKRSPVNELNVSKFAKPVKCFRLLDGDELVDIEDEVEDMDESFFDFDELVDED